jgi:hypothetical protein
LKDGKGPFMRLRVGPIKAKSERQKAESLEARGINYQSGRLMHLEYFIITR